MAGCLCLDAFPFPLHANTSESYWPAVLLRLHMLVILLCVHLAAVREFYSTHTIKSGYTNASAHFGDVLLCQFGCSARVLLVLLLLRSNVAVPS